MQVNFYSKTTLNKLKQYKLILIIKHKAHLNITKVFWYFKYLNVNTKAYFSIVRIGTFLQYLYNYETINKVVILTLVL